MIRRAAWVGIASLVAACSQTGLDPGDDGSVGTGAGGSGSHDGGTFDVGEGFCGDRTVDTAFGETCDDGNQASGDGCDALCRLEWCTSSCGSCGSTLNCVPATCGDGRADALEQCDDGNAAAGDGCSQCQLESGWYCPLAGLPCVPVCGDGQIRGPETCDDQNDADGDGCSSACLTEPTDARCGDGVVQGAEACEAHGGELTAFPCAVGCRYLHYCGDGTLDPGEECDLGIKKNTGGYGDKGCTPGCKHTHYCGDGIPDPGESCDLSAGNSDDPTVSACTKACQMNLP